MIQKLKKFAVILIIMSVGAVPAFAEGVIVINTDIDFLGNTFILDADDSGGDITLQFGGALNKYLKWDDTGSTFAFNDDLNLEGNELKNFKVDNLASVPTCDGVAAGRMYHNTTDTYTYICDGTTWYRIDIQAGAAITGVDTNTFTLDQDDTGGDVTLRFGTSLSEVLAWDDSAGWFYFSDGAQFDGDLFPSMDDTYELGSDTLRWKTIHLSQSIQIENGDVTVGEGGFVVSFINGQTGTGNTVNPGDVLEVIVGGIPNTVKLTNSQNDQPIGVAVNSSAFGGTVNAVVIGKGEVNCTGNVEVGDLIQSSNVVGAAKKGASSTKIIGTSVTACTDGQLTAIIHLE